MNNLDRLRAIYDTPDSRGSIESQDCIHLIRKPQFDYASAEVRLTCGLDRSSIPERNCTRCPNRIERPARYSPEIVTGLNEIGLRRKK